MKKRRLMLIWIAVIGCAAAVWGAFQNVQPGNSLPLAGMMPSGALLYIESPNFESLLADWKASPEKQNWLKSDNYDVFSKSRLFGRLVQAQTEFAKAAVLPADSEFLSQIAGRQSAFAWYDIGKLEFLYITRMPSETFTQSRLWEARTKFEQRQSGGFPFYLRADAESRRTVCFAAANGWVILGTREDLVANALALIGGAKAETVRDESWYADPVRAAGAPGDLRMVLNLQKIVPSPYFRSYWVQQNITEMKQYRAAIADLYRGAQAYREERVLLPNATGEQGSPSGQLANFTDTDLTQIVPSNAGFYQAVAMPGAARVVEILRDKVLDPRPAAEQNTVYAPSVTIAEQNAGQATDLESRIDQAPVAVKAEDIWPPLEAVFQAAQVQGMLQVESSGQAPDGVFTGFNTAIVLRSNQDWDLARLEASLAAALEPQLSTEKLGLAWVQKKDYAQLDGLLPVFLSAWGKYLIVSGDSALLLAIQGRLDQAPPAAAGTVYAAGFNHAQESASFKRLTSLIDRVNMRGRSDGAAASGTQGQPPAFFSGNIASLSRVFSGVTSETIVIRDTGNMVLQTVTYKWR